MVLGPAAGGAAYGPALTDLVILSGQGRIFVTGPDVVRSVTGEDVDSERLGGPEPHSRRSGVVHLVAETDAEATATPGGWRCCSAQAGSRPGRPAVMARPGPARAAARLRAPGLRRPPAGHRAAG